ITFREKGYLDQEAIGQLFLDKMQAYLGDAVEVGSEYQNWWVYWSHFRNFFYVYSYSSGFLIAEALRNSLQSDPHFIDKIKDFLSAGLSLSPKNIFISLGIDITGKKFWEKGIAEFERKLIMAEELAVSLGYN
ncbi:MAG: hypothetical protein M1514_02360, partial [Patescibacteria group bacterium]|nr:hypothetical protein [Patescibacteria group bacterium]